MKYALRCITVREDDYTPRAPLGGEVGRFTSNKWTRPGAIIFMLDQWSGRRMRRAVQEVLRPFWDRERFVDVRVGREQGLDKFYLR